MGGKWLFLAALPFSMAASYFRQTAKTTPAIKPISPGSVGGLTFRQAEDLLDWLENHGVNKTHLTHSDDNGFTVSY